MTTPSVTGFAYARDAVPTVGTTAERDARFPTPPDGFKVWNRETAAQEEYRAGVWVVGAPDLASPYTVRADAPTVAGADLYAKITNAIALLPSAGGIVDARQVTAAGTPIADLTISKKGVTILFPALTITTAYRIVVSAGTHAVHLVGPTPFGLFGSGAPGMTILYTGTGRAIEVGASSSQTNGFWLENVCSDIELAGANATCLWLGNVVGYRIDTCRLIRAAAQAGQRGFTLDGTGGYTGLGMWLNMISNAPCTITGDGVAAGNHNVFMGGNISLNGSGTCVTIDQSSNGNLFVGTDFENASVGLQDNSLGYNGFEGCRVESVTTGYAANSNNVNGSIIRCTTPITYSDTTGASTIEYPGFKAQGGRVVTRYAVASGQISPTEAVLVSGVDSQTGNAVQVTLTAARVVGAPLNPTTGQFLTFEFTQDGTGGWAVTWNAVFKVTWSNTGNTAGKISAITFRYNGTNWVQSAAQSPYV